MHHLLMNLAQPQLLLRHHRAKIHILFFQDAPAAGAERAGLLQIASLIWLVEVFQALVEVRQVLARRILWSRPSVLTFSSIVCSLNSFKRVSSSSLVRAGSLPSRETMNVLDFS